MGSVAMSKLFSMTTMTLLHGHVQIKNPFGQDFKRKSAILPNIRR